MPEGGPKRGVNWQTSSSTPINSMASATSDLANKQRFLRRVTIASVTGNEFAPGAGFDREPVDMKALRHAAKAWAHKNIIGTYRNESSGLDLEIRASGVDETIYHGGAADKIRALSGLPQLMERGIVVFDGRNPKNEKLRLVVVSGKMAIRGEDFFVTAGLRDGGDGKLFYDHELLEVERTEGLSSQSGRGTVSSTTDPAPTSAAHLRDYTINFLSQDASKGLATSMYPMTGQTETRVN